MLLTEHQEQYEKRKDVHKKPIAPSKEELEAIREYVLLPMLLSILEKNKAEIDRSTYSLKPLFVVAANIIQDLITKDLYAVRKLLRERSIKIFEDEVIDSNLRYKYICRGFEDKFVLIRDVARAELTTRLGKYVDAFKKLKSDIS